MTNKEIIQKLNDTILVLEQEIPDNIHWAANDSLCDAINNIQDAVGYLEKENKNGE